MTSNTWIQSSEKDMKDRIGQDLGHTKQNEKGIEVN